MKHHAASHRSRRLAPRRLAPSRAGRRFPPHPIPPHPVFLRRRRRAVRLGMTRETRAGPVETSVLAVSSDASSRAKRASAREASTMTRTAAASNGGYSRMRRDGARRGAKARGRGGGRGRERGVDAVGVGDGEWEGRGARAEKTRTKTRDEGARTTRGSRTSREARSMGCEECDRGDGDRELRDGGLGLFSLYQGE